MTRAIHPIAADTCTECNGRKGFYSDNGPAPRWEACSDCDGAGDWDDTGYIERAVVRSPVMMGGSSFDGEIVSPSVAGELRSLGGLRQPAVIASATEPASRLRPSGFRQAQERAA